MAFLLKVKAFHFQTKIVIKKLTRLALVWASATVYPLVQSPLLPLQKTLNTWETTFCTAHSQIRNHYRISVIRQCLSYKHIPQPYLTTNGNGFRVFFFALSLSNEEQFRDQGKRRKPGRRNKGKFIMQRYMMQYITHSP